MGLETVGGRFRITGIVGRGNMGEVHRAEDLEAAPDSPHRQVAVKTLLRSRTGGAIDTSGPVRRPPASAARCASCACSPRGTRI